MHSLRRETGFTIVELLVVIVVIAILAAITIVSYNGITTRATETALKSDLQNTKTKLILYNIENGTYPDTLSDELKSESEPTQLSYTKDGTSFCLQAQGRTNTALSFYIVGDGVITEGECSVAPVATAAECFAFSSGTITGYYDHQSNNSSLPACPRDVVIPSSIGGTAVTTIGTNALSYKTLTSAVILSGVTEIDAYAFSSNSLTSVVIPESVTTIKNRAFMSNSLTSITIPSGVTVIEDSTFNANQLTTISLPNGLTYIGTGAFENNALTTASVPNATTIASHAFDSGVTVTRF